MHSKGAYHLDLKLENLLIGENYNLKIADFDCSYMQNKTEEVLANGTIHYRAPEIKKGTCSDMEVADVYSAGIILFLLKSGRFLPFREQEEKSGFNSSERQAANLRKLLNDDAHAFWDLH
mmetsp:Transcript_120076/g.169014  ORF Transcript_120076/g.169014 Transcript_120076/m.169014 type:complete len:120 (-) Transcript_120076:20-379(-)